jgi:hypothetical protein
VCRLHELGWVDAQIPDSQNPAVRAWHLKAVSNLEAATAADCGSNGGALRLAEVRRGVATASHAREDVIKVPWCIFLVLHDDSVGRALLDFRMALDQCALVRLEPLLRLAARAGRHLFQETLGEASCMSCG